MQAGLACQVVFYLTPSLAVKSSGEMKQVGDGFGDLGLMGISGSVWLGFGETNMEDGV